MMFEVADIQKAVTEMKDKGVKFYLHKGDTSPIFSTGPVQIATFQDPDGNYLQLIQLPKN